MKWIVRIVLIVVVLLVVAVVAANIVLKSHLTSVLNAQVIPMVEKQIGVPISVGGASVQLLQGSVLVNKVNIGNPPGFADPTLFSVANVDLDISWKPLLTEGIAQVDRVTIKDAELWILRNADSKLNLQVLADRLQPRSPAETPPQKSETPAAKPTTQQPPSPTKLPHARLQTLAVDTKVMYRDLAFNPNQPVEINLRNELTVEGLSTVVGEDTEWATVSLTGNLASDASLCVTDLKGKIAPFSDPLRMSFDLAGSIGRANIDVIKSYLAQGGINPEELALDVNLVCRDGAFDAKASVISLHMDNVQFSGKIKERLPKEVSTFSRLSVPLHIQGTLASPRTDGLFTATVAALMTNLKDNVGAVAAGVAGSYLAEELKKKGGLDKILGEETTTQLTESLKGTPLESSPLLKGILGKDKPAEAVPTPDTGSEPTPPETTEAAKPEDQIKDAVKGLLSGSKSSSQETPGEPAEDAKPEPPAEQVKDLFKKLF